LSGEIIIMSETTPIEDTLKNCSRYGWALIAVGALLRIASFFFSANSGGDAGARVRLTAQWLQSPDWKIVFGGTYLPGHFWLIGLFNVLCRNVLIAGRGLSLVLGIASIVVVWRLALALYGARAAMFSAAVFSFFTLHIGYSTTSSSEVPYLFFTLLAMLLFYLATSNEEASTWYLALSGISLSVAESIRYEAWIVFAALGMSLVVWVLFHPVHRWYERRQIQKVAVFGVTAGAWPAFMLSYSWRAFGDPLYLVTLNHSRVAAGLAENPRPMIVQLAVFPTALLISLSPIAFLVAVYGLYRSFSSWQTASFAVATLFFGAIQFYQILTHGLLANARYSLSLGVFLAVAAGFGFDKLMAGWTASRARMGQVFLVLFLCGSAALVLAVSEIPNAYADKFAAVAPRLRYVSRIAAVARYLRGHMAPNDSVLIDNYNVESNIIADAAGLPLVRTPHVYLEGLKNNGTARDYLQTAHPRFQVYARDGTLRNWLKLPDSCDEDDEVDGIRFRCSLANQEYRVYELTYR
jgi:4-amino-4-deoxy-L-arabinose transferase-like glycosyltransferase